MAKAATDETEAPKTQLWGVRDTNAREEIEGKIRPRIHEAVPGTTYPLVFNEYKYMPEAHARVFLRDAAFDVIDQHGVKVRAMSDDGKLRIAPSVLAPHLVIANVDELTIESLVTRASIKPGGARFTTATPRDVVIQFLIDAERAIQENRRSDNTAASGDPSVEVWDDDGMKTALEAEMARAA